MAYKIGVMMIGSLYWENNQARVNWRSSRLSKEQFDVFTPIRYGRLSKTRGSTYTMVFSRLCTRKSYGLGSAKVVTCKNTANNIDDIIEEAKYLWAAERNMNGINNRFWASWGSIGLLCNPNTLFPKNFFSKWSEITTNAGSYGKISHCKSEAPVLSKNGFFNLPWPTSTKNCQSLSHDIILATATDPTLDTKTKTYPRASKIAQAWKEDTENNDKYFWENRRNGIHTFQDNTIISFLKKA